MKNKITDDTPEKLAHFKDMGELEKIVKKFEPNPETDPVEPGVIAALDSIHYQDFPPKSGLLAGQSPEYFIQLFSRINTHIYYNSVPSKGDKAFYYFNGNKLDTLVVTQDDNIEYNLDRLLNKRNS